MHINGSGAIVTGGSSGLGQATAIALARAGAIVTVFDLNAPSEWPDDVADSIEFIKVDITDDEEVGEAVSVAAATAPLRTLVNCAGIGAGIRTIDKTGKPHSRRVWQRVVDINQLGTFHVMSHASSHMSLVDPLDDFQQRGVIVNTASVAAFDGQIGQLAYAASKAAVVGMTLPAARDLAQVGIRVCTIAPGLMYTPMLMSLDEPARKALGDSVVHPRRLGDPSEFAKLTMAIVDNDYLNGETIRLDGAIRMQPK